MAKPQLIVAGESFSSNNRSVSRPQAEALDFRPLASAAQNMSSLGEQLQQLDDAQALATARQQATEEMDLLQRELRDAGGAANAQETFIQRSAEIQNRAMSGLGGQRLRDRFGVEWNDLYHGHRLKVVDQAFAKGVAVSRDLMRSTASKLADTAADEDDPRLYRTLMTQIDRGVSDLVEDGVLSADEGVVERQTYRRRAAMKTAERLIASDPARAKAALAGGDERLSALADEDRAAFVEDAKDAVVRQDMDATNGRRTAEVDMRARVRANLDSITKTGDAPDEGDGAPLSYGLVKDTLGKSAADEWRVAKREARRNFYLDRSLSQMDTADLDAYAEKNSDPAVVDRVERIKKDRSADPVRASIDAFGGEALDLDGPPDAIAETVKRRALDQEKLGVDGPAMRVLTNKEATDLAGRMDELVAAGKPGLHPFMKEIDRMFGDRAEDAFRDVLLVTSGDKDMATIGASVGRKVGLGIPPSRADALMLSTVKENNDAARAFMPASDVKENKPWTPGDVVPNYSQIQMLLSKPDLAAQFEQKFGAGAAKFYLTQKPISFADEPLTDGSYADGR